MARLGSDTTNMAPTWETTVDKAGIGRTIAKRLRVEAGGRRLLLGGRVVAEGEPWQLCAAAKAYIEAPHTIPAPPAEGYVYVYVGIEACDRNIEYVRALYREIKARDLDETRSRANGFFRCRPGPRNANPSHERIFGARVEWRIRYYPASGKVVEHNSVEIGLSLLHAGYDIGFNAVTEAGPVPCSSPLLPNGRIARG